MAEIALDRRAGPRLTSPTLVIAGASLGTLFEWYDFFLYGSLAANIAGHFFAGVDERTAFIFALAAFAAGYIARPFGALVFGRIGDLVGRKNTFLVTMTIMGLATFLVGVLPDYRVVGVAAPILLVSLRIVQGLAVGGEYGGAVIYVAEHAPPGRRGLDTSWINAMATLGLTLSLLVIIGFRLGLSAGDFQAWGWRAPFLISALLLGVSLWVRMKLGESPVFSRMKAAKAVSKAPWSEAFGRWSNLKLVLIALGGSVIGPTTIWYTAQFYTLFFLQRVLKVADLQTNLVMVAALVLATPSYLLFGWLSDKIGRKPILVLGCALSALLIIPAFHALTWAANPALAAAQRAAPVVVMADPRACSVQFDPVGANHFDATDCDIAKATLSRAGISYRGVDLPAGSRTQILIGGHGLVPPDPRGLAPAVRAARIAGFTDRAKAALASAGYPATAAPAGVNMPAVIALVIGLILLAAMTYAPNAAMLVEMFPARIRYTSLSVPYHLGTGWVGGLLPATAFAIVAANGDIYAGLWYPVVFCAVSLVISLLFLPETRGRPIEAG